MGYKEEKCDEIGGDVERQPTLNLKGAWLVCFMALATSCFAQGAPFTPATLWRSAEVKLSQAVTHEDATADVLWREGLDAARGALVLRARGCRFEATDVYACRALEARGDEPARRCRHWAADDTIHVTEFPPFSVIHLDSSTPMVLEEVEAIEVPHVEIGDPSIMHRVGYRGLEGVPCKENGALQLGARRGSNEGPELLIVTIRSPNKRWIFKFVWIIHR